MPSRLIALVAVSAILLALIALWLFGRDERVILKRLTTLSETVTMEEFNAIDTAMDAHAFTTFFTDPVTIDCRYEDVDGIHSHDEFQNLFLQGRASAHTIRLYFDTPEFESCKGSKARLRTQATLTIHFKGAEPVQEQRNLILDWEKHSGKWQIHQIQTPTPSK